MEPIPVNIESPFNDIETLDADGALRETAEEAGLLSTLTRRGALATGGAATAAVAVASMTGTASALSSGAKNDIAILNFALTLEHLEANFYREALDNRKLFGLSLAFCEVVAQHEATHVATLTEVIKAAGGKPVAAAKYDFKDTTKDLKAFNTTSYALEGTGVAAYLGQGANIRSNTYLGEAVSILAVESRHYAWMGAIRGVNPTPKAFWAPHTKAQTLAIVKSTGFIK